MLATKITGIGGYLPPRAISNSDLEKILDTTDEWITQRTGIKQRFWVEASQCTSDLALEAARGAIEDAGIQTKDIDMIIFATSSPDTDIPGSASFLQAKLDLGGIPYFDIRQACSGFLYGIDLADKFIRSGQYKCVLLVGAEVQSKGLDLTPRGRGVSILFGDGAGAVILQATTVNNPETDSFVQATKIHADGHFAKELWMPCPGSAFGEKRLTPQMIEEGTVYPEMNGRLVFMHAVTKMPEVLNEALTASQKTLPEIDMFFFHQANMRINQKVGEDLGIPSEKIYNTIEKFGNTTAATIPLGMWDAKKKGLLKPGMLLGLASFGAGFTWASTIVRL
ncbi:MAG: 3-oxoacyl-ACP synthase III family protein [Pseudobdellovibrionaceae bacterium]